MEDLLTKLDIDSLGQVGIIVIVLLYLAWDITKRILTKADLIKLKEKELTNTTDKNNILKSLNENLGKQSDINKDVSDYLFTIHNKYTKNINEEQFRLLIQKTLRYCCFELLMFSIDIVHNNNLLNNKKIIVAKIKSKVNSSFEREMVDLKQFKYIDTTLNTYLDAEKEKEISDLIINSIYESDTRETRDKQLKFSLKNKFQEIYNEFLNKK